MKSNQLYYIKNQNEISTEAPFFYRSHITHDYKNVFNSRSYIENYAIFDNILNNFQNSIGSP